uniref:DNA-directed RNA polymerase n=1 Tax=Macrostomum lignano TaxID=282301 RepID=A0A1I8G9B3_9PLAT
KGIPAGLILRAEGRKHAAKRVEPLDIAVAAGVKRTTRQTTVDGAGQQGFGYRLGVDLAECRSLDVSQSSANVAQLHCPCSSSLDTASSRSQHSSSMREDSSRTLRRSLVLSAAAIELSNFCSTAKSLSFCLAASVLATVADEPQRLQPRLNSVMNFTHSVGVSVQVSLAQRLQCLSSDARSCFVAGGQGAALTACLSGFGHCSSELKRRGWEKLRGIVNYMLRKLQKLHFYKRSQVEGLRNSSGLK